MAIQTFADRGANRDLSDKAVLRCPSTLYCGKPKHVRPHHYKILHHQAKFFQESIGIKMEICYINCASLIFSLYGFE